MNRAFSAALFCRIGSLGRLPEGCRYERAPSALNTYIPAIGRCLIASAARRGGDKILSFHLALSLKWIAD